MSCVGPEAFAASPSKAVQCSSTPLKRKKTIFSFLELRNVADSLIINPSNRSDVHLTIQAPALRKSALFTLQSNLVLF